MIHPWSPRSCQARREVAIAAVDARYGGEIPYHPSGDIPEAPFPQRSTTSNPAYDGVREALRLLGLDRARFGSPDWNPLARVVQPGDTVVLKPNFVLDRHGGGGSLYAIVTHPSVLRAVADYVALALQGRGRILVADAPQMDCDFGALMTATGLEEVQQYYRRVSSIEFDILDLRPFWYPYTPGDIAAYEYRRRRLDGDPHGCVTFDLGGESAFRGLSGIRNFYGADYDRGETIQFHDRGEHRYVLSRSILEADCVISVPKLKVHKKVGVTLNCKGLVGTVCNKNCLVHYRLGTRRDDGDQYPEGHFSGGEEAYFRTRRALYDRLLAGKDPLAHRVYALVGRAVDRGARLLGVDPPPERQRLDCGNWHGNDTAWRMVADLTRVLIFGDREGTLRRTPQRRLFSVVDGIVGGEGDGPLRPDAKHAGVIVAGANWLAVDTAATALMGLDPDRLRWLVYLRERGIAPPIHEVEVSTNRAPFEDVLTEGGAHLGFRPHPGWTDFLERP